MHHVHGRVALERHGGSERVIQVAGEWWGTAAQVAEQLGVDAAVVRSWARRDGLASVRTVDENRRPQVWYALGQAMVIDRTKRIGRHGRPRCMR